MTRTEPVDATDADAQPPPRRLGLRRAALVLAAVIGVGAALGVAGWWWLGPADAGAEETPPAEGDVLTVEPMTVGLVDDRHARIGFGLVLAEGVAADELEERLPLVNDAALSRVAGFEPAELSSPEGQERLKEQLTADAREVFGDADGDTVVRVILHELVVQ